MSTRKHGSAPLASQLDFSREAKFVRGLLAHFDRFNLVLAVREGDSTLRQLTGEELNSVIHAFLKIFEEEK